MDVKFPLVKEVKLVVVDEDIFNQQTGTMVESISERHSVVRDDGVDLLRLLSQVDWNKPETKDKRRDMGKIMRQLRDWNFDHSRRESALGSIVIEWGRVEKLKKLLLDEYPKDLVVQGVNMVWTLEELEDWFDLQKAEIKKAEDNGKSDAPASEVDKLRDKVSDSDQPPG